MITVGIDEVGRGCWAGPLVAAAASLPDNFVLPGSLVLRDSKKMTKKQREATDSYLREQHVRHGLGWVWPEEIDSMGITAAVKLAMERAVAEIGDDYDELIIDGNINYFPQNPKSRAVIKADDTYQAVSAASIIAKVARDNYMVVASSRYPLYGFDKHVGYGTAVHIAALQAEGVTDIHRKSYKPIQKFMEQAV